MRKTISALRYRQIHLDFHTSGEIKAIGNAFDKKEWQAALRAGRVDSITCFSKCHHGWSYHPTTVGAPHPHLNFDLLRAQFEACKEIDVNVPIYLSAGLDNVASRNHPEWREISIAGTYAGTAAVNRPGFHKMCLNGPYLDYLCAQIREAVTLFPDCDGVFLDIIHQGECCCVHCVESMRRLGLDLNKSEDRRECARQALLKYYRETTDACRRGRASRPVFHNSGHIAKNSRDLLPYFSHLELESLPTGGWGYDHFPMSAAYTRHLGKDFLGMTGKFHTTWGEFGGYKHPNALRYECAAMLAHGAKCSVGDQLHPNGKLDPSTYDIIGAAYAEVEAKEPWCAGAEHMADVAVLSSESEKPGPIREQAPDTGVGRVLLEEHILFDLIDRQVDFSLYKLLILPDDIVVDPELKTRIDSYLEKGGKLLLSGRSGLRPDGKDFALDIGAEFKGESPHQPDYLAAGPLLAPEFVSSPLVMYAKSQQVIPTAAETLAGIRKPYFNRAWDHFCSHQHAPDAEPTDAAGALRHGRILYLAHPVFSLYAGLGVVAHRQYIAKAIRLLLDEEATTLETNLPSTARATLTHQAGAQRYVLHLLYANTVSRGGPITFSEEGFVRNGRVVEVIEDLIPLHEVEIHLRLPREITNARLQPRNIDIGYEQGSGKIGLKLDSLTSHQMIELSYA